MLHLLCVLTTPVITRLVHLHVVANPNTALLSALLSALFCSCSCKP